MPNIRITNLRLLSATALSGSLRIVNSRVFIGAANPGLIRIVNTRLYMAVANRPGKAERIVNTRLLMGQSIHRRFYLTRLESTSTVSSFTEDGGQGVPGGGNGWELELVAGPIPEFNPYKPQVPESLILMDEGGREFYDYIEENQKTLRMQHNLTQAGDTTFPYQLIINTHTEKHYTLGSVGKFYHEDHGMILARYVQFEKMDSSLHACSPVGLIKKTGNLDWIVTNRLDLSSPYLCVGVNASYTVPEDGQYGWVTIDGVNLQPLNNNSDSAKLAEPFVWSASGEVSNQGAGVIIGRRLDTSESVPLLKGRMWIRLESFSEGAILTLLDTYIQAIAQLQEDVEALQDANNIAVELAEIQSQLQVLTNRLSAEENARRAADTAINARISAIDAVTESELNNAIASLEQSIINVQAALTASIAATHAIALEALDKANQALAINIDSIQDQITLILQMLSNDVDRPKGKFPVVDGSVPPNLVYLDDGSLVYTETY